MKATKHRQLQASITQLRAEIEALPKDPGGRRLGIQPDLRRRVVGVLRDSGLGVTEFSRLVAVSTAALSKWRSKFGGRTGVMRGKKKGVPSRALPGFKQMRVTPDALNHSGLFTLEGPSGLKLTGLGVDQVASLWKALC